MGVLLGGQQLSHSIDTAVCPWCHYEVPLIALFNDAEARGAFVKLAELSMPLGARVLRYVALFGTARQRVTTRGELRLIAQLQPDMQRRAITHKGRDWTAPLTVWDEAFEEVFSARDSGALELPLTSHGYLYAVIQRMSDRAEAQAEAKAEKNKRLAPRRDSVQVRGESLAIGEVLGAVTGAKDKELAKLDQRDREAAPMPESVRAHLAKIREGSPK